ncbi:MAG TPA: hypothetical protein VIM41_16705 [Gammaproteobacteria bacterium]
MSSSIHRIVNVSAGSGLIFAAMVSAAPLGGWAVLPLMGAVLVLVGVLGENPGSGLADKVTPAAGTKQVNGASHVRARFA